MTVVPGNNAVTTPDELIVAATGSLLDQTPPAVASVSALVKPLQMLSVPDIGAMATGVPLTVTDLVATAVPHALVTV